MLDTNAVHYARLYLEFARAHTLSPFVPTTGVPTTGNVEATIDALVPMSKNTRESLKKGWRLIEYLRPHSNAGDTIQYSPVAQVELVSGRLRGEAILDAASENIPHRLWSRFDEREIFARLEWAVYARVQSETEGLDTLFEAGGINVTPVDPSTMMQVWDVARRVLGCIYLELGDCAIYASALLAEATEVLSGDGYFRELVGWVHNPGSAPIAEQSHFERANSYLKEVVAQANVADVADIHLPMAPKW